MDTSFLVFPAILLLVLLVAFVVHRIDVARAHVSEPEPEPEPLISTEEHHLAHVFPEKPESVSDGWGTWYCTVCHERHLRQV